MKKLIVAALALFAIQFATGSPAEARHHHRYYHTGYGYGTPVYYGNGYNHNNGYIGGNRGWNHGHRGYGRQVSMNGGRRWH